MKIGRSRENAAGGNRQGLGRRREDESRDLDRENHQVTILGKTEQREE